MESGSLPPVVVDQGAHTMKVGFAGEAGPRRRVPTCTVRDRGGRRYVGDQLSECAEPVGLAVQRPFDRGYPVNFDQLRTLWDRVLGGEVLGADAWQRALLLTEPTHCMPPLQNAMDELVFEACGFREYATASAAALAMAAHRGSVVGRDAFAGLVVDAGYSFSHVAPVFDGVQVNHAVKRVDVGGKVLTNYLKDAVSFRSLNVMDETNLMNEVKQLLCYVSDDFMRDMRVTQMRGKRNTVKREYVMPDYSQNNRGYVRGDPRKWQDARAYEGDASRRGPEQSLILNNERIMGPELLFSPQDIGLQQAGIPEAIVQAVSSFPEAAQEEMYANVVLVGGCTLIPGYRERVEVELRKEAPSDMEVRVHVPESPIDTAWQGGSAFASSVDFSRCCVTKAEYEESGSELCRRRFMS